MRNPEVIRRQHVFNLGVKDLPSGGRAQDAHYFLGDHDELLDRAGKLPTFTANRSPEPVVMKRISTKIYPAET